MGEGLHGGGSARRADAAARHIADLRVLLRGPGCFFCREERDLLRRYFFWFGAETYAEAETLFGLERSLGFCPRHALHLVASVAHSAISFPYGFILQRIAQRLRRIEAGPSLDGPKAANLLAPTAPCPVCETERQARDGLVGLVDRAAERIRGEVVVARPLCLRHFEATAPLVGAGTLEVLADAIDEVLADAPGSRVEDIDPDRPAREAREPFRGRAPQPEIDFESWSPSLARLLGLLERQGCPLCLARDDALHAYLAWLASDGLEDDRARLHEAVTLCRAHWHDFTAGAPEAAARAAEVRSAGWRSSLGELRDDLSAIPPEDHVLWVRTLPGRYRSGAASVPGSDWRRRLAAGVAAAFASPRGARQRLRARYFRAVPCGACDALATATDRTADLLRRSLGDPTVGAAFARCAGLCLRDLLLVLSSTRDPADVRTVLRVERARFEVLDWEVDEAHRKRSWSVRYERKGGEQSAWARAVQLVSGTWPSDPHRLATWG